ISVRFAYSLIGFSACSVFYFVSNFVSNAELLLNTVLKKRNYFLNVSVAQANNVANIRFRISPWIEDGIGARKRRILMIARGRIIIPFPPQPIEIAVMQPEDRIGR